ncbi:MAG TPA: TolC family protein [Bryobacteraceae bacterium]|nr:TolC family protein [Bryobacteraceae bacterium]
MRFPLLFLLATAMLRADEAQILTPVPVATPQVKDPLVTSKFTPTASAPAFGTPSWFRKTFHAPPTTRVELKPPARLNDFVVDGKLELSLRSYIDLVLANNTDVSVERLSVEINRNNILRAYSIFDPLAVASFNSTRTTTPAGDVLAGATTLNQLSQPFRLTVDQVLPTGTRYSVGFNASKTSTNSAFATFNPLLSSNLNFNFSQPLLRGRGTFFTKLPVTIARGNLRSAEYTVENRILNLVSQAELAYWDVILAREDLRVQEQALSLSEQLLKRAQRELELGAISALDIYQPEAQYANFKILVSQARFRQQEFENVLRRFMGADLDPQVRELPIVLTETIAPPVETALDREKLIETALRMRPDLKARRQDLDIDDLTIQGASNQLKPDLSLTAQYGSYGRGGTFYQRTNVFTADGTRNTIVSTVPGGFGDALDQLFGFNFPVYGFGLRLSLPLRDRRASADYANAVVTKRLDTLRLRSAEQTVRQDVLNAISRVESSRASVELAKIALDFAQKRVDADQKKYDLGTITLYFLLDSQNALARAQSDLVEQSVNYRRNLVNLQRTTGELLAERNIAVQ